MKPKTNPPAFRAQDPESDYAHDDDNEESVGGKECGMCHDVPESIIYLSCEHIVCLICAAKLILGGVGDNQAINLSEVVCGICHETTVLSVEVQETLIEFLNQQEFDDEEEGGEEEASHRNQPSNKDDEEASEEESVQINQSQSRRQVTEPRDMEESVRKDREERSPKEETGGKNLKGSEKTKKEQTAESKEAVKGGKDKRPALQEEPKQEAQKTRPSPANATNSRTKPADQAASKPAGRTSDRTKPETKSRPAPQSLANQDETDEFDQPIEESPEGETEGNQEEEASEFLSTFYCVKHHDEEYTYYNPSKKALFCAQCLITEVDTKEELSLVRPLKKCLPEILQNFQDMLNEIEVAKSLLENKRKDFDIRKEGAKVQAVSMAKKLELAFDEVLDFVQEVKLNSLKALEARNRALLSELEGKEEAIEERANFFGGVLDEVTNLRQNSQTPEEELFVFFFANQERISKALTNESAQSADSEALKINRVFDDFMAKTKQEQMKQCRLGQEAIRERLSKNIVALGGASMTELVENPFASSKAATLTADFPKQTQGTTKNAYPKPPSSLLTLAEPENSTRFANQPTPTQADPTQNSKRLNSFTNSETYGQFVEKVKNLPTRNTSSLDVNKYLSQVRGLSRGAPTPPSAQTEPTAFGRDFTSSSYYKTVTKNSYNLEKKLELEQKLKFFDLKSRKEETNQSGYSGILNLSGRVGGAQFGGSGLGGLGLGGSGSVSKGKDGGRADMRSLQSTAYNTGFRTTGWMFGK